MNIAIAPRNFVRLSLGILLVAEFSASASDLRALVLSGDNNHKWKETTPAIVEVLKETGKFDVDVEEDVPGMRPEVFSKYDVIVSNYNTIGSKRVGEIWNPDVRKAFVDHLRSGHGLVIVHAGSSVFYDWPEFQSLACATWKDGTKHANIHANRVSFLPGKSPITEGLEPFWIRDEFWQKAKVADGSVALAEVSPLVAVGGSGVPEQILFSTRVGGARGVALLLGHDAVAMANPAWRSLLQRSCEWAATGKVTIPPAKNWPRAESDAMAFGRVSAASADSKSSANHGTLGAPVDAAKSYK